ncbi:MAG: phosphatidate cytidylyltransferase [candidate division Zixibacteria bacterium]|nr:phosphatidate cytidylyltransferase [candidate division Zixibacteria bacterium]
MSEKEEISLRAEFARKGIHILALVIPIGYSFLPFYVALISVTLSALISIFVDISRFRQWKLWHLLAVVLTPIIRDHEFKGGFSGASYILTTSAITIALFPKPIAVAALVFIIIGDTAAALIGRRFGRHKIIGKKSFEGSGACLLSLAIVSFFIPGLPTPIGLAGALVATLAELFTGKIDDNFTVPISSGFVMLLIMHFMEYEEAVIFSAFR